MKEVSKNPQVIAKKMLDISVFMTKFHIDDLVNPEII
jgi:hypothetical protein